MKLSLIVPVFNEEQTVSIFYKKIKENDRLKQYNIEILFVNDGSTDNTETIINALSQEDSSVVAISFTRNFGKESALFCGLEYATGDAVIPIDVDLQDPIEIIPLLIEKWQNGADIVLAKRVDRKTDNVLKRKTAEWFYKLHNKISNPKIEENVGDFRLISRNIVEDIKQLHEKNLFMKGVFSWVGGKTDIVEYTREKRVEGNTKFNFWKLWNLAIEGITSFSTFPLKIWTYIGFFFSFVSFIFGSWIILKTLLFGNPVPGYSSLLVSILFFGGIQLTGIGIIGEYIGRIYIETKNRPRYIIKKSKS
ncbi:glycosyltransferase family 2 protein [Commensalibacter oyaizuii]|uniref:Glycosyltransferase family 2 protein n=1 Tax=Commensalibacter oyaizuii TaxID=3043873 RepID=A0ABT6Q3E1_9PROT|nr:glycosyltransferase family 2 protein [Commensalibacter sp. TBRC 16381]MDI2091106.1 glycosyltransferase family 2 protein [Commensalibacter sp. TBRC 16381]